MANLFVPIYSMRSYSTGKYDLSKDGNFQLIMSRLQPGDGLVVPWNSTGLPELMSINVIKARDIINAKYGENAYETRKMFWDVNQEAIDNHVDYMKYDAIVTDITGYKGRHKFFCNFNITKDPNHPLSYIDEFIESDVDSINRSLFTTVLNQGQIDYLVNEHNVNPEKLRLCRQVISKEIIDKYTNGLHQERIDGIFFPFRLTDKCYNFDYVYDLAHKESLDITITDPNQSYDRTKWPRVNIINNIDKRRYYSILMSRPLIVYMENPERCFHPGLAELIYFNCKLAGPYLPEIASISIDDILVTSPIYE